MPFVLLGEGKSDSDIEISTNILFISKFLEFFPLSFHTKSNLSLRFWILALIPNHIGSEILIHSSCAIYVSFSKI